MHDVDPARLVAETLPQGVQHLMGAVDRDHATTREDLEQALDVAAGSAPEVQDGLVAVQGQAGDDAGSPSLVRQRKPVLGGRVPFQEPHRNSSHGISRRVVATVVDAPNSEIGIPRCEMTRRSEDDSSSCRSALAFPGRRGPAASPGAPSAASPLPDRSRRPGSVRPPRARPSGWIRVGIVVAATRLLDTSTRVRPCHEASRYTAGRRLCSL